MAQPADHVSLSITSIKLALESEKPGIRASYLRSSAHFPDAMAFVVDCVWGTLWRLGHVCHKVH